MKQVITYLLILTIFSCKTGVNNSVSNAGIDQEVLNTLFNLETTFLNNIKTSNYLECENIMSDLIIQATKEDLTKFLKQVSSIVKNNKISIIDQYHIQNSTSELPTTLFSSLDSLAGYILRIKPVNKEAFISLRRVESDPYQYLMLNMYSKYGNDWKLDMVKFGEYSIKNKNAQLLHYEAIEELKKDNLINASNLIFLSSKVSKPAGNVFSYKNFKQMESTFELILAELKSKLAFPIEIKEMKTIPVLLNFSPEVLNEGIFPTISYQTRITLSDTIKLKSENLELHEKIETVLPNIKKNNNYIIYKAMNEIPTGDKLVNTYTFVNKNAKDVSKEE